MKTTGLDRTQYYGWHAFPQGKHAQVFDQSMPPTVSINACHSRPDREFGIIAKVAFKYGEYENESPIYQQVGILPAVMLCYACHKVDLRSQQAVTYSQSIMFGLVA